MAEKKCFIISPIGNDGTETRNIADKLRSFLKYEILDDLKYECIRADDINKLGIITSDVIAHIIDCELVIAVLEYDNVNVYYELALRHATTKPCISIISKEKLSRGLPFDTQQERVFKYPLNDMKSYTPGETDISKELAKFKNNVKNTIITYNEERYEYQNPVTAALHKAIIPKGMNMQSIIDHINYKIDSFHQEIDFKLDNFNNTANNWIPKHIESIVGDMYRNGSAMYISGEKEAFDTLCEMTKKPSIPLERLDLHHRQSAQVIAIFLKQFANLGKGRMWYADE